MRQFIKIGVIVFLFGGCSSPSAVCETTQALVTPQANYNDSSMQTLYGFGIEESYQIIEGIWNGDRENSQQPVPVSIAFEREFDEEVTWTQELVENSGCGLDPAVFPIKGDYTEDNITTSFTGTLLREHQVAGIIYSRISIRLDGEQTFWYGVLNSETNELEISSEGFGQQTDIIIARQVEAR